MELIDKQAAIDELVKMLGYCFQADEEVLDAVVTTVRELPSAQPEIIRCRNCKFASGDSRICMKLGHSPIGELDFCSFAERREVNNESN